VHAGVSVGREILRNTGRALSDRNDNALLSCLALIRFLSRRRLALFYTHGSSQFCVKPDPLNAPMTPNATGSSHSSGVTAKNRQPTTSTVGGPGTLRTCARPGWGATATAIAPAISVPKTNGYRRVGLLPFPASTTLFVTSKEIYLAGPRPAADTHG